jgi:hypothetical protein
VDGSYDKDLEGSTRSVGVRFRGGASKTYLMFFRDITHKAHDLKAGRRIQTTCRLIKEHYLGRCDELLCHADSAFLSSTDALSDWRANQRLLLVLQPKRGNQRVDAIFPL